MADFRNCKKCGKFFTSYGSKLCTECQELEEEEFRLVRDYIYDYPGVNMKQVADGTEVPLEKILRWLKEERLILKLNENGDMPDTGLNCEKCSKSISTGKFCDYCKNDISSTLKKEFGLEKPAVSSKEDNNIHNTKDRMYTAQRRK